MLYQQFLCKKRDTLRVCVNSNLKFLKNYSSFEHADSNDINYK